MRLTEYLERPDLLQHDNVVALALASNGTSETGKASPDDNYADNVRSYRTVCHRRNACAWFFQNTGRWCSLLKRPYIHGFNLCF
jgi:hypothetical protein